VGAGAAACSHIEALKQLKPPRRHECEECVKIGSSWGAPAHLSDLRGDAVLRLVAETPRERPRSGPPAIP